MSGHWIWRVGFGLALAVIVAASLMPWEAVPQKVAQNDKIAHMAAWFGLGFLGALGWPRLKGLALVGLPLVGLAVEVAQGSVGRYFDWADAFANAAGIGAGVTVAALLVTLLERKAR